MYIVQCTLHWAHLTYTYKHKCILSYAHRSFFLSSLCSLQHIKSFFSAIFRNFLSQCVLTYAHHKKISLHFIEGDAFKNGEFLLVQFFACI